MVTSHVYPNRRMTVIRVSGASRPTEWHAAFDSVRRHPQRVDGGHWVFVAMDSNAITSAIASDVAREILKYASPDLPRIKCAFVIPGTAPQTVMDAVSKAGVGGRLVSRTFTSEAAALAWVGWASVATAVPKHLPTGT